MIKKVFFLLLSLFLLFSPEISAKVYLVAVGIADYPGVENDLRVSADDARKIAWLYSKNSDVEYQLLVNQNATKSKIVGTMKALFSKAGKDDIVVLFFSGHGYQGGFMAYDQKLPYNSIRSAMSSSKSRNKMIFADACFSGKIRADRSENNVSFDAAKKANVMLFLSSRSDEVSYESPDKANSLFTLALERGLRGGADANRDRIITAKELFVYVQNKVIKSSNGAQHPVMWGKFPDEMPVMIW